MPASDSGLEEVVPATNQRSSVVTARRKTRFVVSSGSIGMRVFGSAGVAGLGFDREKRSCGGAKRERVPVPVRSGRCSPVSRMRDMRSRYWYSSCERSVGTVVTRAVFCVLDVFCWAVSPPFTAFAFSFKSPTESPGGAGGLNHASTGSFSHAIAMMCDCVLS